MTANPCPDCAGILADSNHQIERNSGKIKWVAAFNLFVMIGEVVAGRAYGSMALVAEGWHMGSHVAALVIALLIYRLAQSSKLTTKLSFGPGKLLSLGGYTSAIVLGVIAILILLECGERLLSPVPIVFNEAIIVACIGLVANVVSASMLHSWESPAAPCPHHPHGHGHDHNIRAALVHVIADAVTAVLAIGALAAGKYFGLPFLDPIIGIVGAFVILSWAAQLAKTAGWDLVDGNPTGVDFQHVRDMLEKNGARVVDLHIWRIAPGALACEVVVSVSSARGVDHYRELLKELAVRHLVVEERT